MIIEPTNNELHIEYFPNGKKQCEGSLLNHRREGKWTFWNEEGKKVSIGSYKNGIQHLQWTYFDDQGRNVREGYDEGKKHGLWHYWDDKGREIIENHHKDGYKNGLWHYYDNHGNTRIENYIGGKKNGCCRYICKEFNIGDGGGYHWDKSELIEEMLAAQDYAVARHYFTNET
ncbi:hypothetical protein OAD78_07505, partial [Candidatus Thioglobus sp.]|nr:hypothetical protein [Candidatus Thioglobus sp.]